MKTLEALPEGVFELEKLVKLAVGEGPLWKNKEFKARIRKKRKGIKVQQNTYG